MGRLIDTSELAKRIALQKKRFGNLLEVPICNVFADMIRDTPTTKAIPKADYENRLKADMVTMLEELQLKIEEKYYNCDICEYYEDENDISGFNPVGSIMDITDLIQEKINTLKGEK